ncbi:MULTISPECIES: phasin family protein [unclassified Leptolyngbya]|uniref:phasin family protein n=1 Tax=unclassified Leptolyngbya TaxID=2650499 RepID=UPI001682B064|nr:MULTISPECIES: phasin family protein [unclassified Leptolyngbya]MBD1912546.1 phasin family protein [Leptolyngbya sp. FACHB-8]MBD2156443.1 phasin family protein [Leptolyngbya sp. FACHB-16]
MPGFGDLVQRAFYLGVGLASYAGEKAGSTLADLRSQAQKLADEMVARGEITAEDAKRMVDEMMRKAQQPTASEPGSASEPRRIEILEDEDGPSASTPPRPEADNLRQQVEKLQEELRRLSRE